jgi:hypothetical protein
VEKMNTEPSQIIRFRLKNAQPHSITLHIEPWGEHLTMAPGVIYEVAMSGPAGDSMELSIKEKDLVVYGWAGSTFSVNHDRMILCDCRIQAPATPSQLK